MKDYNVLESNTCDAYKCGALLYAKHNKLWVGIESNLLSNLKYKMLLFLTLNQAISLC